MLLTKIAGLWKKVVALPVNAGGTVKPVQTGWTKVNGTWSIFFQAFKALRFAGTAVVGSGNKYRYELISTVNVTIAQNDVLVFEMYPQGPECATGIDGLCFNPDGSEYANLRDWGFSTADYRPQLQNTPQIVDQNGRGIHANGTGVAAIPLNKWCYRRFNLSVAAGKTIKQWAAVLEGDTSGDYVTLYRYIRVEDANGNVKATIFDSSLGVPAVTVYNGTSNLYTSISKGVVTAPL